MLFLGTARLLIMICTNWWWDEEAGETAGKKPNHVVLEDHVWLGAGVTVLKGVTIGHDAVVAAGAIVTKDVPPLTLVAGVPARPVRQLRGWR